MSDLEPEQITARIDLLREAADDCEDHSNDLLNDAPHMGHTKEARYRLEAAHCLVRACALRAWADDMEQFALGVTEE